jgi:hypothetical protein
MHNEMCLYVSSSFQWSLVLGDYSKSSGENLILGEFQPIMTPTFYEAQIKIIFSTFGPVWPLKQCYLFKLWKEIV